MKIGPKDRSDYYPYRATHYNGRDGGEISGPSIPEGRPLKMGDLASIIESRMNEAFWAGFDVAREKYESKGKTKRRSSGKDASAVAAPQNAAAVKRNSEPCDCDAQPDEEHKDRCRFWAQPISGRTS